MSFTLDDYLPYLVNRLGVRLAERFAPELARFGITLAMWRVLAALWPDRALAQLALARRTSIEASTLSRLLQAMERRQLIERRRARRDSRVVEVALAPAGQEMTAAILPLAQALERQAAEGIAGNELRHLKALLARMFENVPISARPRAAAARANPVASVSAMAGSRESPSRPGSPPRRRR